MRELQLCHFWLFLGISLAALLGNGLIITSTACDQRLHTPITGAFAYLKSPSISSPSLDLVVSVLYSVVPPAVNPLIYSLRNQELKDAVRKLVTRCVSADIRCLLYPAKGFQCRS
ncbi:olfactory receptor 2D3-like [Pezoporus flaviventris]|uniref:olfactory receptor 2D3-like n=1 Tax=Pezoporus flaviventris TaxID=889875 RepID=UPI002AB2A4A9|nr:olfactory receptor 2D3-like [Pezoporus flaviventris]